MGSARLKEQSVQLRQKLKRANEDLKKFRKEIDALRTGRDRLQSELEQANEQIYRNRIKRDSERDKTGQGKKDQLALDLSKAESKIDGLERQLDEAKGELRRRERDIERIGQRAASSDTQRDARMVEDNRSLREENEKLRDELSAFDMEFFEEIEDLKYNYQQVSEENNKLRDRIRKLED
jgi:chromosome segregation ATPase